MMATRFLAFGSLLTVGLLVAANPSAIAQVAPPPADPVYQGTGPAGGGNVFGGGWGGMGGFRASTAAEGAMQGMSSVINAQGQKNLNDSMAVRNMQEARSRALDNQVKHVQTFQWRKDNAVQRQQQQMYENRQKIEPTLARARLGNLTTEQYNPATGQVAWPMLLRDPVYNDNRQQLDDLLAQRAKDGELTMDQFTETTRLIRDWRMQITADKDKFPTPAVSQALRFLLTLNKDLNNQFG